MHKLKNRLHRRRKARQELQNLFDERAHLLVIHYSCESFIDRPDGSSPRITSIAVRHEGTGQVTSFSIHQVGERRGIMVAEVATHYDSLERQMLDEFAGHVAAHKGYTWLHWNMRDANYGFAAIDHRHRVLGGTPSHVPEDQRRDLAALLIELYGPGYVGHPRLPKLLEHNKISRLSFLNGQEEADAFAAGEYVKLHQSTLRKVDVLANIFGRTCDGTLKTKARWHEEYGASLGGVVEAVSDHWIYKSIGALAIVATFLGLYFGLYPRSVPPGP
jgi:hypothetical protein